MEIIYEEKIGNQSYKQPVIIEDGLVKLWANEREERKGFTFPSMKENKRVSKPRITIANGSHSISWVKKLNGKWVFPEVRVPSAEDRNRISKLDMQIASLKKQRRKLMDDRFMTWDFLTLEKAEELINKRVPANYGEVKDKILAQIEGKDKSFIAMKK